MTGWLGVIGNFWSGTEERERETCGRHTRRVVELAATRNEGLAATYLINAHACPRVPESEGGPICSAFHDLEAATVLINAHATLWGMN